MKNNNNCSQHKIPEYLTSCRIGWLMAVMLSLSAMLVQAEEYRYRYTALDQIKLPTGVSRFIPYGLTNNGRVYGQAVCDETCSGRRIAYYKDGVLTVIGKTNIFLDAVSPNGSTLAASELDPVTGFWQNFLLYGNVVERIPPQPDESFSFTWLVNDRHAALLQSYTANDTILSYVYFQNGLARVIDFGPTIINPQFVNPAGKVFNNDGIIAGTSGEDLYNGSRGFRYDTKTGKAMILQPLPGDNLSWGWAINNSGYVLGHSIASATPPYHENIGVWDRHGQFKTYFAQSIPNYNGYPITSGILVFNDHNVIVITQLSDGSGTSLLVPKPGVRLDIGKLVVNLPAGVKLEYIDEMNNRGDLFGIDRSAHPFLLERLCPKKK